MNRMDIPITKVIVVYTEHAADFVSLRTTIPGAVYPYQDRLDLTFRCAQGCSRAFLAIQFPGVPIEEVGDVWVADGKAS